MTYGKPWICDCRLWVTLWIWVLSFAWGRRQSKNGCEDFKYHVHRHTSNPVNPGGISVPPMAPCVHHHLKLGQIQTHVLIPTIPLVAV